MSIYITIWCFLLVFTIIRDVLLRKICLIVSILCLLVLYTFRGIEVGVDTSTYYDIFNSIKAEGYLIYMEPLWNILNIIVIELGGSFNTLLFFSGLITLWPIYIISKKYSVDSMISIFVYYSMFLFCGSLNISRQYLAISLLFLSYCIFKRNKIGALILFIIAFGFHFSSIFFLITLPLFYIKRFEKRNIYFLLLISLVIGSFLIGSIANVVFLFGYDSYGEGDIFRDGNSAIIFVLLMNIFYLFIVRISTLKGLNSDIGKLFILSAIVLNTIYKIELGTRIYNIFAISNIVYCPLVIYYNVIKQTILCKVIICLFFTICFFRMIFMNSNEVIPYIFARY